MALGGRCRPRRSPTTPLPASPTLVNDRTARAPDRLSPELDALLRAAARPRRLSKGELLYARGSAPSAVFRVVSGAVQLSTTSSGGREAVLGVVEPGRWFGELTLFIDAPRVHDARALADAELLVVAARDFHRIVDDRPDHLAELLRLVCHRYKWAIERIDAAILLPLPLRLARELLISHERAASDARAGLRVSQEALGQMLGVSRQSVNRQLKAWEAAGLLTLSYGRVTILDAAAMRRASQAPTTDADRPAGTVAQSDGEPRPRAAASSRSRRALRAGNRS